MSEAEPRGRTTRTTRRGSTRRVAGASASTSRGAIRRKPTATRRELDNRFSTMTEVRRVLWPAYEAPAMVGPAAVPAGHRGLARAVLLGVGEVPGASSSEVTGHAVPVFQRVDQAGFALPLDERVLADARHAVRVRARPPVTEQVPRPTEIEAAARVSRARRHVPRHRSAPRRRRVADDLKQRDMEYLHHGDALVPRQQRFGGYTRSLMKGARDPRRESLGAPPGGDRRHEAHRPADASTRDLDTRGWLAGVTQLQLPHAPAALRGDGRRPARRPRPGAPADRSLAAASVHERRQQRVQRASSGCRRATGAPATCWSSTRRCSARCSGRREPRALLEEHRHGAADDARARRHPERRPAPAAVALRGDLPRSSASTTATPGAS